MSAGFQAQQQQSYPLANAVLEVIKEWILDIAITALLHGVNATLVLVTSYQFLTKSVKSSRAQNVLYGLLVLMLILSTVSLVLSIEFNLIQVPLLGYNPPDVLVETNIEIARTFIDRSNYFFSDAIVVWRAWILFPDNLAVKILLSICILASLTGVYTDAGLAAVRNLHNVRNNGSKTNVLIIAAPLLITNLIATSLIGLKTWNYYRDVKKNLDESIHYATKVEKLLVLLVESGIMYCTLWIAYMSLTFSSGVDSFSTQIYIGVMPFLSALYPALIMLIVALEKSRDELSSVNDMSLSQSIRFAGIAAVSYSTTIEMQGESWQEQFSEGERS